MIPCMRKRTPDPIVVEYQLLELAQGNELA